MKNFLKNLKGLTNLEYSFVMSSGFTYIFFVYFLFFILKYKITHPYYWFIFCELLLAVLFFAYLSVSAFKLIYKNYKSHEK